MRKAYRALVSVQNRLINPDYFCMILTKCVTFLFQNLQSL